MTEFEMGSLTVAALGLIVTGIAAAGIWHGIHAMVRANKERGADARADRQAAAPGSVT